MTAPAQVTLVESVPADTGAPAPLERHYSVKSASDLVEQSQAWFRREIKAGRIRAVRLRSVGDPKRWSVRIPESEIKKVLVEVER